jgi:SAM-dependent methyltransferase
MTTDRAPGHDSPAPSPWLLRWAHLIRPGGQVLDVACGRGRHVRWLLSQGFGVTAVDRDPEALAAVAPPATRGLERMHADLESGPWPIAGRRFDAVLVTNYLWRPLMPQLREALADGAVLLYETFAAGNETVGRPSRPEFLLQPGELMRAADGLRVVAYEDGFVDAPPRFVQRIAAVAPAAADAQGPARHPLAAPGAARPAG